jgi:hypothetical protein
MSPTDRREGGAALRDFPSDEPPSEALGDLLGLHVALQGRGQRA